MDKFKFPETIKILDNFIHPQSKYEFFEKGINFKIKSIKPEVKEAVYINNHKHYLFTEKYLKLLIQYKFIKIVK